MLELPDGPDVQLRVADFHYEDALNDVFEARLHLIPQHHIENLQELVGKKAVIDLGAGSGLGRVTGLVRSVAAAGSGDGSDDINMTVVAPLWLTSQRRNNRIFQRRTVPQIVADVLAEYPAIDAPVERLHDSYAVREYVTQYAETDLELILRLLAEEGITLLHDHADQSKVVLIDQTPSLSPERSEPLRHVEVGGARGGAHVSDAAVFFEIQTARTHHRDYRFDNPRLRVEGTSERDEEARFQHEQELESYEFRVGAADDSDGARRRAEHDRELREQRRHQIRLSGAVALASGTRITVSGHGRQEVGRSLLVVRSHFSGQGDAQQAGQTGLGGLAGRLGVPEAGQAAVDGIAGQAGAAAVEAIGGTGVSHEVQGQYVCIDAALHHRPARRPRPEIAGTHTAFVVGAAVGEEIDVDEHGRVLIEFPWDRRHQGFDSSRRVRVSQGWAGPGYGLTCFPRIGDEVVVTFLGNDPDQPLVIGRVFNGHNRAPINLPEDKTQSMWRSRSSPGGAGYNEIMLEDRSGEELVRVRAHRNYERYVGVDSTTTIGNDRGMSVGRDTTSTVKRHHDEVIGGEQRLKVAEKRSITVGGDEEHAVAKSRKLDVQENATTTVGGKSALTVEGTGDVTVRGAASLQANAELAVDVSAGATTTVGADWNIEVADRLRFVVGSAQVTVHSDGQVRIMTDGNIGISGAQRVVVESSQHVEISSGADVQIDGSANVQIRGGQITMN